MVVGSRLRMGAFVVLFAASSGCSVLTNLDGLSGTDADAGTSGKDAGDVRSDAMVTTEGGIADGGPDADASKKYSFTDDFNRPDTVGGIGNGWNEKAIGLRLSGGEAERFSSGNADYRDTIASRPATETAGDIEVSVEFRFKVSGGGYAQVHARVQTGTLATPGALDSYILFRNLNFNDNKTFTIARQRGGDIFSTLRDFPCSAVINTTNRYRMRLRVTGSSPVQLEAFVERKDDAAWTLIGSESFTDSESTRIGTPGVVGISAGNDPTGVFAYDNFSVQEL